MLLNAKIAATAAALALSVAPAAFATSGPPAGVGNGHVPTTSSVPAKAQAYGTYCRTASRKHVAGQKGTPFSQCVTAMAKVAKSAPATSTSTEPATRTNPVRACASMSKKHVAGQKGTPFSQCVLAAAKLLQDKQDDGSETSTDDGAGS